MCSDGLARRIQLKIQIRIHGEIRLHSGDRCAVLLLLTSKPYHSIYSLRHYAASSQLVPERLVLAGTRITRYQLREPRNRLP